MSMRAWRIERGFMVGVSLKVRRERGKVKCQAQNARSWQRLQRLGHLHRFFHAHVGFEAIRDGAVRPDEDVAFDEAIEVHVAVAEFDEVRPFRPQRGLAVDRGGGDALRFHLGDAFLASEQVQTQADFVGLNGVEPDEDDDRFAAEMLEEDVVGLAEVGGIGRELEGEARAGLRVREGGVAPEI